MAPGPPSPSLMEQTCTNLKLTLARSMTGITSDQLSCDYRNMTGEGIPFRRLGFDSLGSLLDSLPDSLVVRKLPTGGRMVGLREEHQTSRNSRWGRNVPNPKRAVRRPKQQSTDWTPPTKNNRTKEIPPKEQAGKSKKQITENKKPLRQPRQRVGTNETPKLSDSTAQKPEAISSRKLLEQYFARKELGEPQYKIAVMGSKGRERFLATITVEGNQYKTYPDSFQTKEQAEEAVSGLAITKLGVTESLARTVETLRVSRSLIDLTRRVRELLELRSNGVWSHQVEAEYSQKFSEKLPSNWVSKLEEINQIKVDIPVPNSVRVIIFPTGLDMMASLPPQLNIPQDNIWEVFVTVARSANNVNCRIIGPNYSDMYENLISDLELHYFDAGKTGGVTEITLGKLYAAQISSDWHRVKVLSTAGDSSTCFFIDHGDEDSVPISDLRELDDKFLLIAPQVLTVEMSGLQEYQHSDSLLSQINQHLLGKPLAAKVENRQQLGKRVPAVNEDLPRLIFFDTSSEDVDININQKLIEFIVQENSQSRLPKPGGEEILVRVVRVQDGDLFVVKEVERSEEDSVSQQSTIRCRLEGAPPPGHSWSPAATEAFRDRVSTQTVVTLRVIREHSDCPYVELNFPDSNEGSINFDLSTEFDIFPLDSSEVIKTEVNNNLADTDVRKTNISGLLSLKTLLPPDLPAEGTELELTVSYAVSPDNFVILPVNSAGSLLSTLTLSMSEYYQSSEETGHPPDIQSDKFAAARLNDKEWQRVEVLQVVSEGSSSLCVVRYVDQGSQAMLQTSRLRVLPAQFRNLPCQAIMAGLAGLRSEDGWRPEDNFWFNSRVTGRVLRGVVTSRRDNTLVMELIDPRDNQKIHDQLIGEGRGQVVA